MSSSSSSGNDFPTLGLNEDPAGTANEVFDWIVKVVLCCIATLCFVFVCWRNSRVDLVSIPLSDADGQVDEEQRRIQEGVQLERYRALLKTCCVTLNCDNFSIRRTNEATAKTTTMTKTVDVPISTTVDRTSDLDISVKSGKQTLELASIDSSSVSDSLVMDDSQNDNRSTKQRPDISNVVNESPSDVDVDIEAQDPQDHQDEADNRNLTTQSSKSSLVNDNVGDNHNSNNVVDDVIEDNDDDDDDANMVAHMSISPDETKVLPAACSICLNTYQEGESIVWSPICSHAFHHDCMEKWLLQQGPSTPQCPYCRGDFVREMVETGPTGEQTEASNGPNNRISEDSEHPQQGPAPDTTSSSSSSSSSEARIEAAERRTEPNDRER